MHFKSTEEKQPHQSATTAHCTRTADLSEAQASRPPLLTSRYDRKQRDYMIISLHNNDSQ